MKKIVFYFLALLLAVWLGVVMHKNPGYVLIASKDISVETSLWFFVVTLIVFFLVIYFLLRFSSGASRITSQIKHWIIGRRERRAHAQTVLGLYDFIEGNWRAAEKKLSHFAKHSDMSLVNYLVASLAAERQREFKRRDNYLRLAKKFAKDRPVAAKLAEATLKIGNEQLEEALSILEDLRKSHPKNNFVFELLQQVYLELEDWRGLKKILPNLRKRNVLGVREINQLEEKVYGELLLLSLSPRIRGARDSMTEVWNDLPRYLQKSSYLVTIYAGYLLDNKKDDEAEDLLKIVLRKNLDKRLLRLYAALTSRDPIKHLTRAEKWLKGHPDNLGLLLCLGKICRKQKLWGKSRHYLERSIKVEPTSRAYAELGQLMAEQNDLKAAVEFYEKATELSL